MYSYFKGTLNQIETWYFTYQIQTEKEIVYVGFGHLNEIYSFRAVSALPTFDKKADYTVIIHAGYQTRFDAVNAMNAIIREVCKGNLPRLNLETFTNKGRPIICNETGVKYPNAFKACEALNIHPPRMSAHLHRRKGHKSIHGLTFSYLRRDELP